MLFVQDLEQLLNKNLEQPIILNFFWILVSNCSQPDPGGHCRASGGTQRLSFQNENFFLGCSRFFLVPAVQDLEQAGARPKSNIPNSRFWHRPNMSMIQLVRNFEGQRAAHGRAISIAVHTGKSMVSVPDSCPNYSR